MTYLLFLAPLGANLAAHCRVYAVLAACGRNFSLRKLCSVRCLGPPPLRARRPARGRPVSDLIASSVIFRLPRLGNSARCVVDFVKELEESLYIGDAVNILYVTWRGEAPGAAPTR